MDATAPSQQPLQAPADDAPAAGVLERLPARFNSVRAGATCTGSMAPAITCVDEATYRTEFHPQDIVPGTIISFYPACPSDEGPGTRPVAHRVVDVKIEQGRYSYWPKGDARREPDGCWVPAEHVQRYLVAIHAGARPENTELRDAVAGARAALNVLMDRYCGIGVVADDCQLSSDAEYEELAAARDHLACWHQSALDSEYPGHIPQRC